MPKLSDLGTLRSGLQLRGAAEAQTNARYAVIQLGDVRDGAIDFDRVIRMDPKRVRLQDLLEPGDILLRSRGASYGAAVISSCPGDVLAAAPLYILRLSLPKIEPDYVAWYINRSATQSALESQARGTHIPTVSIEAFKHLDILLPSLGEQREILELALLLQQETALTLRHITQRTMLVQAAQETVLSRKV
jgi:restriction endonuclease S subunit